MQGVKTVLTDKQLDYLVRHFKDTDNEYLAIRLGISETVLHRFARRFGLKKTKAHMRQMQHEAAAAAKASHLKHGTYPPKGHRIPRSEEFQYKPGDKPWTRCGRRKWNMARKKAAETWKETFKEDRCRRRWGLPQKTKLHVKQTPRQRILDRSYLKKRGYILDEVNIIAYWTPETRRATRLEAAPRRFYKFAEYGTR